MLKITLKRDRERSLLRRHPWVFSGAIDKVLGDPQVGDTVSVFAQDGRFLGHGDVVPLAVGRGHRTARARVEDAARHERLQAAVVERTLFNGGTVIVPALPL